VATIRRIFFGVGIAVAAAGTIVVLRFEPRTVWCRVDEEGTIEAIRATPDGPEVPHGATMTAQGAPWAYYYELPTRLTGLRDRLGFESPRMALLLATGRETRSGSGRWLELLRCDEEEFDAVLGWWRGHAGQPR